MAKTMDDLLIIQSDIRFSYNPVIVDGLTDYDHYVPRFRDSVRYKTRTISSSCACTPTT